MVVIENAALLKPSSISTIVCNRAKIQTRFRVQARDAKRPQPVWCSPPGWWSQMCSWAAGSTFHTGGSAAECDALLLSPAAGSRWRRNDCSCCSAETGEDRADS